MNPASRAVIFDMDGVLVDSYRAHFESWSALAEQLGHRLPEQEFAVLFGRTSRDIIQQHFGDGFDAAAIENLDQWKEKLYREQIREDFPVMPGAAEFLAALARAGVRMAVGSSGPRENVALVTAHFGAAYFGAEVTGADVTRGKPDPQVFLLAAERLGVPPSRCAVIEDAPAGLEAARAAGMVAIGFASTGRTVQELRALGPRAVVGSFGELEVEAVIRWIEEASADA